MFQGGGYSLVTVAECLGMEPYVSVGQPSEPNVSLLNAMTNAAYIKLLAVKLGLLVLVLVYQLPQIWTDPKPMSTLRPS